MKEKKEEMPNENQSFSTQNMATQATDQVRKNYFILFFKMQSSQLLQLQLFEVDKKLQFFKKTINVRRSIQMSAKQEISDKRQTPRPEQKKKEVKLHENNELQ